MSLTTMGMFNTHYFLRSSHCRLFLLLSCRLFAAALWERDSKFDDLLPQGIDPASSVSVHFMGHCALLCEADNTCKGFFYNEGSKECFTTSSIFLRKGSDIAAEGSRYYRSLPLSCPSDGVHVLHEQSGTCFQLNDVAVTWAEARDACSTTFGAPASLDTAGKEETLMNFFRAGHPYANYYHIGGHRPFSAWSTPWPDGQPDFVWLSGQPVNYSSPFWGNGEPNMPDGSENTLIIYPCGTWCLGDYSDSAKLFYVCEYEVV